MKTVQKKQKEKQYKSTKYKRMCGCIVRRTGCQCLVVFLEKRNDVRICLVGGGGQPAAAILCPNEVIINIMRNMKGKWPDRWKADENKGHTERKGL